MVNISENQHKISNASEKINSKVPIFGVRHVQALLLFVMFFNCHTTRTNLSIALVAMTDRNSTQNSNIPVYDWTNTNVILSSFNWTYIILQITSGYVFKKFGVKWTMSVALFFNNAAFLLIPTAAHFFGYNGVIFCYAMQGLFQGFCMPCGHHGLGRWAPLKERAVLSMIVYTGIGTSILFTLILSGLISSSRLGWPATFYIFGAIGMVCCMAWAIFSFDSPDCHPTISYEERVYIQRSLKEDDEQGQEIGDIPLKAILTSLPFWAIVVANAGNSWGFTMVQSDVPTYINKVLKYDIATSGLVSATPQITQLLLTLASAPFCDFIVRKKYVSLMNARRIYQLVGSVVPAMFMIWLAYVSENQKFLAVILLNTAVGINAVQQYGALINHIDISPRYASILVSFENSISTIFSISAPLFVQYVVSDLTDISLWKYVFLTFSGITVSTSIFFVIFGSADMQWWNFWKKEENRQKSVPENRNK